jgi:hypothetical protein
MHVIEPLRKKINRKAMDPVEKEVVTYVLEKTGLILSCSVPVFTHLKQKSRVISFLRQPEFLSDITFGL